MVLHILSLLWVKNFNIHKRINRCLDHGEAFAWGSGEYGALGIGSTETQWAPVEVILDDKRFVGIEKVSCGSRHTAFISGWTYL